MFCEGYYLHRLISYAFDAPSSLGALCFIGWGKLSNASCGLSTWYYSCSSCITLWSHWGDRLLRRLRRAWSRLHANCCSNYTNLRQLHPQRSYILLFMMLMATLKRLAFRILMQRLLQKLAFYAFMSILNASILRHDWRRFDCKLKNKIILFCFSFVSVAFHIVQLLRTVLNALQQTNQSCNRRYNNCKEIASCIHHVRLYNCA